MGLRLRLCPSDGDGRRRAPTSTSSLGRSRSKGGSDFDSVLPNIKSDGALRLEAEANQPNLILLPSSNWPAFPRRRIPDIWMSNGPGVNRAMRRTNRMSTNTKTRFVQRPGSSNTQFVQDPVRPRPSSSKTQFVQDPVRPKPSSSKTQFVQDPVRTDPVRPRPSSSKTQFVQDPVRPIPSSPNPQLSTTDFLYALIDVSTQHSEYGRQPGGWIRQRAKSGRKLLGSEIRV